MANSTQGDGAYPVPEDPRGTVGAPSTTNDMLDGELFHEWARHRPVGLNWEHSLLPHACRRADIQYAHSLHVKAARSSMVRLCEGRFQDPQHFECSTFGVDPAVEAHYLTKMQALLVQRQGCDNDILRTLCQVYE